MFLARALETSMLLANEVRYYQCLTGYSAYEDFCYLVEKYTQKNPSGPEQSFVFDGPQNVQVSGSQGHRASRDICTH